MSFIKYTHRPKNLVIKDLEIEYTMTKEAFDEIANTRGNKNQNPGQYVIEYINDTFGLLGTVTELNVEGEFLERGQRAKLKLLEDAAV